MRSAHHARPRASGESEVVHLPRAAASAPLDGVSGSAAASEVSALATAVSSWVSTAASMLWSSSVAPVPVAVASPPWQPASPDYRRAMPLLPRVAAAGSGGLDICFVMDCTGSMGPWIEAATTTIKDMISGLPASESCKRVAVVAYRDFGEGEPEVQQFSENLAEVTRFLDRQAATGGDDPPEDIAGALSAALGLQWVSETRTVVLVTDAPCHGSKYHDDHDNYPQGDPTGLSMVRLMQGFRCASIDFTFVQLTSGTDKMQSMLRRAYESAAGAENVRKFELRDLRDIIEKAGGATAVYSSPPAVSAMLSAAVAPSLSASLMSTKIGSTSYAGALHSGHGEHPRTSAGMYAR